MLAAAVYECVRDDVVSHVSASAVCVWCGVVVVVCVTVIDESTVYTCCMAQTDRRTLY